MGHKNICIYCRKSFNQGTDLLKIRKALCPECGNQMIQVDQKFKPPKVNDLKKWEVVAFLTSNGFFYQRIYKTKYTTPYIPYLEKLEHAKEFIIKYADQALTE